MKALTTKTTILLFIIGFLIGNTQVICVAAIVNMTSFENSPILITEPLVFSSLTGNHSRDSVHCVGIDQDGNLFLSGITDDTDSYDDSCDTFLMKINGTNFSPIIYYTIKGSKYDYVQDMVVRSGKVYLVGYTGSPDFPVKNAYCDTFQNSTDCFIMCFDANSMDVLFSTYLGGKYEDIGESIFVDDDGSIYVTGDTASTNFPMINSYGNRTGFSSVFVTKLNSSGTGIIYSSVFGGENGGQVGLAIVGDSQGNAYVAGVTTSDDFPTVNALNATSNGVIPGYSNDGFILCLNSTGNGLTFSTYLGGSDSEAFYDIVLDSDNDVWVCGYTESNDFPLVHSYQEFAGDADCLVLKLSFDGSALLYSSLFGGPDWERCFSMAIDSRDNVYVTGESQVSKFPLVHAVESLIGGLNDCFIMKISPENSLLYSTLIGGQASDWGKSITVGENGTVLVGGTTFSDDFPQKRAYSNPSYGLIRSGDGFASLLMDISDEDGDAFPNWWEIVNGFDPFNPEATAVEILMWYAPVIITISISATLILVIFYTGRNRIKSLLGRNESRT